MFQTKLKKHKRNKNHQGNAEYTTTIIMKTGIIIELMFLFQLISVPTRSRLNKTRFFENLFSHLLCGAPQHQDLFPASFFAQSALFFLLLQNGRVQGRENCFILNTQL